MAKLQIHPVANTNAGPTLSTITCYYWWWRDGHENAVDGGGGGGNGINPGKPDKIPGQWWFWWWNKQWWVNGAYNGSMDHNG